jgi:hypothetical protein
MFERSEFGPFPVRSEHRNGPFAERRALPSGRLFYVEDKARQAQRSLA